MDALNPVKTITESASRMALAMLSVCDECLRCAQKSYSPKAFRTSKCFVAKP
jgi:hypothetical protein